MKLLALAAFALVALLPAGPVPAALADACPNEARRVEQGKAAEDLPDCRAFELASPGSLLNQDSRPGRASVEGGAVTYYSTHPAEGGGSSGFFLLARRGPGGWTVRSAAPQVSPAALFEGVCEQNVFLSPDLTKAIDEIGWFDPGEPAHCKGLEEDLTPGEPRPWANVLLHDYETDSFQLVNVTPEGVTPANTRFQDASDDFSHIVVGTEAQLAPGLPAGSYGNYIWVGGELRLLTILPDGTPVAGELVDAAGHTPVGLPVAEGNGFAPATGALSADGELAFFYAEGNLYLRRNAGQPQSPVGAGGCTDPTLACTVEVDRSQGPGASGGGLFWRATEDGGTAVFTSESRLTPDSGAEAGRPDLYRYDAASEQLTDLTPGGGEAADVRGVSGMGESGAPVYFVANGVLAPGASPGNCGGAFDPAQRCNLYVVSGGTVSYIATLPRGDRAVWLEGELSLHDKSLSLQASASPSGRYLAFTSSESLTGYDNSAPEGLAYSEIFRFDSASPAGSAPLQCVSCPPHEAPAAGPASVDFAGSYAPGSAGTRAVWRINSVLDDGTVFFDTEQSLVPGDTNGLLDVYEFEDGAARLLSGGSFPGRSSFLDASPDGTDVYFRTAEPLIARDRDQDNVSLYDARAGGGFPEPPPPSPGCDVRCRPLGDGPAGVLSLPTANPAPVVVHRRHPRRRCAKAKRQRCKHGCARGRGRHCSRHRQAQEGKP
ncbi:MAG TPA: hypothetical protein VHP56_01470 [Solirubrobacterales bacterium]|jgi:hypothetical protein|nr:hypothetical protein [Solirubrobacterales bacterium]